MTREQAEDYTAGAVSDTQFEQEVVEEADDDEGAG